MTPPSSTSSSGSELDPHTRHNHTRNYYKQTAATSSSQDDDEDDNVSFRDDDTAFQVEKTLTQITRPREPQPHQHLSGGGLATATPHTVNDMPFYSEVPQQTYLNGRHQSSSSSHQDDNSSSADFATAASYSGSGGSNATINPLRREPSSVFASMRRGSASSTRGNSARANRGKSRRDYQFHDLIGEGALGKVFRATRLIDHQPSDEEVAIKVVKKSRILHSPLLCQMVREEVRIHSRPEIIRNPYIVTLKSSFQDESFLYYVFEYVAGLTLGKTIERLSQFRECSIVPMDLVRLWMAELLYVVWTLGNERVVHRDLKPENIIIERGHVKVLDFNNALIVTDLSPESVYTGGFTNRFFSSKKNNSFPGSPLTSEILESDNFSGGKRSALSNPLGSVTLDSSTGRSSIAKKNSGKPGPVSKTLMTEPANIFQTEEDDSTRIDPMTDFGGTLPYWAPERVSLHVHGAGSLTSALDGTRHRTGSVSGSCVGTEFDVWSLGCLMYEMMTGVNPFLRATPEHTADAILRYASGEIELHFPSNIGHLARDLCRKLLDPLAVKRVSLLSSDYEAVLAHPFFAGFSFKTPLLPGIDPDNLIESIWRNSISMTRRGGTSTSFNIPSMNSGFLEFTPEAGKPFSAYESFYAVNNSPQHMATTLPGDVALRCSESPLQTIVSSSNDAGNDSRSRRKTSVSDNMNAASGAERNDQPVESSPLGNSRSTVFLSGVGGPPGGRTSFADASTAASQRPTGSVALLDESLGVNAVSAGCGGQQSLEGSVLPAEVRGFSVPSKSVVSASTPQRDGQCGEPCGELCSEPCGEEIEMRTAAAAEESSSVGSEPDSLVTLSKAENWLTIMVSEKYREFMISEVVEGLQCILREQMSVEEYEKIDSQGMEFVKAADVLTWGPIRLTTIAAEPKRMKLWKPLTISPQQQCYIAETSGSTTNDRLPFTRAATVTGTTATKLSNSIVQRQPLHGDAPTNYSTSFLCCIRSPSYLLYNRVKRWLTPVQTPVDGGNATFLSSDNSDAEENRSAINAFHPAPAHVYPEPTRPSSGETARISRKPPPTAVTTTGYGVLSAKFGLLMFEVDLVEETSTFKYMIELQKHPFRLTEVSEIEKDQMDYYFGQDDTTLRTINGQTATIGGHAHCELIQLQFTSPISICNRENKERIWAQKLLIDVGDPSNLNYWYPHLRSFLS